MIHFARLAFVLGLLAGVLILAAGPGPARAQVPPHVPGTICFTPNFWCWAERQGTPGAPCTCPTARGSVNGVLG